jgi:hypothetical protein|tara:strand:- start:3819 stop:4610 length:792 start_codon:yes stop_codon:yes gene_type:complete
MDNNMSQVIENIYTDYLKSKNELHREKYQDYEGYFSASSAGQCFKKQILRANGVPEAQPDGRVLRLLRLGTIVHKDFELALNHWIHKNTSEEEKGEVWSEMEMVLDDISVIGHADIVWKRENRLEVIDIKTIASYKWTKQFGRIKNRDRNPSVNYELQLGTYALGAANYFEVEPENIYMYLVWYKKDDSSMKVIEIPTFWMDNALEYWVNLNEYINISPNGEDIPVGGENIPVQEWECNYCGYHRLKGGSCPGVVKTKQTQRR